MKAAVTLILYFVLQVAARQFSSHNFSYCNFIYLQFIPLFN